MALSYAECILRDTLYNLHPHSGASNEKCTGICQGLITWQMCEGKTFTQAIRWLKIEIDSTFTPLEEKPRYHTQFLPACWVEDFEKS